MKVEFIALLSALLKNGFTLREAIPFMKIVLPKASQPLQLLESSLMAGNSVAQIFKKSRFDDYEITVLSLAEVHGDFIGSLDLIGERLKMKIDRRQQLLKVLAYPMLLVGFLLGILIGLRQLILPEMTSYEVNQGKSWGQLLIQSGPEFVGLCAVLLVLTLGLFYFLTRGLSKIDRMRLLTKVPIVGHYLKYMITAFFANEIGKLLGDGLEMKEIILVLGKHGESSLTKEFSQEMSRAYESGVGWSVAISEMPFLRPEFSQIILRGEAKGQVGLELVLYSDRLWKELNAKNEKALLWLQPIIFLIIAIVILSVYGSLLLPIYTEMEGTF